MCTCVEKLQKKLVGTEHKKKKVTKAEFMHLALIFNEQFDGMKTYSEIELSVEGGKRPMKQNIIHTYCPFCGKKYSKK